MYSISENILGVDDKESTTILYWYLDCTRGSWTSYTLIPGIADILIDNRYGDNFYYEILSEDFPDLGETAMYDIGAMMEPEYFIGKIESKLVNFAQKYRMTMDMTPYREDEESPRERYIINPPQKGVW